MKQRNMSSIMEGDLVVIFHNETPPSDEAWDIFVDQVRRLAVELGGALVVVRTHGGAPGALQRARLNEVCKEHPVSAAVMTDSAIARGAVTAFSWISSMNIRAFPIRATDQALKFLGSELSVDKLEDTFRQLEGHVARRIAG